MAEGKYGRKARIAEIQKKNGVRKIRLDLNGVRVGQPVDSCHHLLLLMHELVLMYKHRQRVDAGGHMLKKIRRGLMSLHTRSCGSSPIWGPACCMRIPYFRCGSKGLMYKHRQRVDAGGHMLKGDAVLLKGLQHLSPRKCKCPYDRPGLIGAEYHHRRGKR